MRSPALAIGWEFRKRHSWPLIAMGAFLFGLAVFRLVMFVPGEPITVVPPDGRAAVVIGPLSWAFFYYLAVFSFGLSGDLGARQSIFPARMFSLPVKTAALVGWPMLYGTMTVAALVFAATVLARWPWEIDVPLVGPALFAAAFLAWTQALMWMPYGLPAARPIVTVLWLAVFDAAVLLAAHYKVSEPVMLAILAPQIPIAYLVARYAVARARRGDVPDWRPSFMRTAAVAAPAPLSRAGFGSPARAQLWFEWRRQGRTLPALVGILLPFELALFWIARDAPALLLELLLLALITPPLAASFAAATVSKANPDARDSHAMSPFIATRPLSSADLIAAKLKMAIWSTLAAWLLVIVAVPLALIWSGTWPMVEVRASRLVEIVGMPRTIVFALLVLAGLMASTWKQLVQSMYIGLTGREWISRSTVIAVLMFVMFIGPVVQWIVDHNSARAMLWHSLPLILAVLVALKMLAAAGVAARLTRSGLLSDRTLVGGAATWVAVVFALYGVLAWLVSGPLIPQYCLVLLAILAVPLARVSAAPLALAWNRHR
ncbi:MAG: hypothetical protein Q8Q85_09205 [Gemmatimonadales bacterium]|nr:hypothetical protein [Gemmatimonadales bacterium]